MIYIDQTSDIISCEYDNIDEQSISMYGAVSLKYSLKKQIFECKEINCITLTPI